MRIPISIKLIVYFLVISTGSIFIIGKFSWYEAKNAIINRTYQQLRSIRTEKEKNLISFFNSIESDLNFLTVELKNHKPNSPKSNAQIAETDRISGYLASKSDYLQIKFCFSDSNILAYSPSFQSWETTNNIHSPAPPSCLSASSDSFSIIDTVYQNENQLIVCRKLQLPEQPTFHILIYISHHTIDKLIFSANPHNGLGKTGEVYLVGNDSLMRSSSRFIENASYATRVNTKGVRQALSGLEGEDKILDYRGIEVLSSFKKLNIPSLKWAILAEIDYDEATEQIKNIENNIIYLSLMISLLLLGVIAALSSSITSPIRKLQAATIRIAKGQFAEIPLSSKKDEIADLVIAFNSMNSQLQEQRERLEYEQVIKSTLVIDSQEEERQRLSRELHDSLGQSVLAIKLKIENLLQNATERQQQEITDCLNLIADSIHEIRVISNNLMPAVLQQYGLITAIENLGSWIKSDCHCEFNFQHSINSASLSKKTEIYLFRIIQEAFNNSLKHGKSNNFAVKLEDTNDEILLSIQDNGIGSNLDPKAWKRGNGLNNMRERVNLLSGTIEFVSAANQGFIIKIAIPV